VNESEFKTKLTKQLRDEGGYGRRFEDQYAVGIPDCMLVPRGGPVFMVEAKVIRASTWGPSPRQTEELKRISGACCDALIPLTIGFPEGQTYSKCEIHVRTHIGEDILVWKNPKDISGMLRAVHKRLINGTSIEGK